MKIKTLERELESAFDEIDDLKNQLLVQEKMCLEAQVSMASSHPSPRMSEVDMDNCGKCIALKEMVDHLNTHIQNNDQEMTNYTKVLNF